MLGGLHIKMVAFKCLGYILRESGWTGALEQAKITSAGSADAFLKVVHVKKTLRAHQITAWALFKLKNAAYKEYLDSSEDCNEIISFDEWSEVRCKESQQFFFWNFALKIILDILAWDRSVHEGDFQSYISTLSNIAGLFFALDHAKYARAISIHLRDMMRLKESHPVVFQEFSKGNFTVNKTGRPFSSMPLDEAHEHNNALVKGEGGAIGLTENAEALHRWMVSGPEVSRLIQEFLNQIHLSDPTLHHEQMLSNQIRFANDVRSLEETIKEMGDPFTYRTQELITLDSRVVADKCVIVI